MENDEIVVVLTLFFVVIVLLAVKMIGFIERFNRDTRYITRRMQRARDYNEYRRWRGELRCHYLCLIPFVNERNVMRLYRRIYHKTKHRSMEKRSDGLYHILAPSVIGIFICSVCLCGASWAWFTSTQTSSVANIQTATYTVSVMVQKGNTDMEVSKNGDIFEILLEAGSEYTVILTADGNAKSGYCNIEFVEAENVKTEHYTPQIIPNNVFKFDVTANSGGTLHITPQWGTCSSTGNKIGTKTPLELGTSPVTGNNEPASTSDSTEQEQTEEPEETVGTDYEDE